jgi:hypothetical protein
MWSTINNCYYFRGEKKPSFTLKKIFKFRNVGVLPHQMVKESFSWMDFFHIDCEVTQELDYQNSFALIISKSV